MSKSYNRLKINNLKLKIHNSKLPARLLAYPQRIQNTHAMEILIFFASLWVVLVALALLNTWLEKTQH
jgi:hypothetical protein